MIDEDISVSALMRGMDSFYIRHTAAIYKRIVIQRA